MSKIIISIILEVKCHCLEKPAGQGDWVFLLRFNKAFTWSSSNIHLKPASTDETFFCCVVLQCLHVFSPVRKDIFALYPLLLLGISCLPPHTYLLCGGTVSMLAGGVPEQKSESTHFLFFLLLTSERQRHSGYFFVYLSARRCSLSFLSFPTPGIYVFEKALLS